jgi:hypothetical protein
MRPRSLFAVSVLLLSGGSASYAQISSSTTGISGAKNPEKIPTHVAAFAWFHLAATNMNDDSTALHGDADVVADFGLFARHADEDIAQHGLRSMLAGLTPSSNRLSRAWEGLRYARHGVDLVWYQFR